MVAQRILKRSFLSGAILAAAFAATPNVYAAPAGLMESAAAPIKLTEIGRYRTDVFDRSAAEIVAYDAQNKRIFVINSADVSVDVLDIQIPSRPVKIGTINASAEGGAANSVAVRDGVVAVAIENNIKTENGKVVFYNAVDLGKLGEVEVGALPDMLTFTPDGRKVLVANEGEPNDDYTIDPEGSVSIIDVSSGISAATVTHADFSAFNGQEATLREQGVRIFGPNASAAQDFEPEYIAVAVDGRTAWVALQENNAIAELDVVTGTIRAVRPLGFKDHSRPRNALDASNRDGGINIRTWPVLGMYMPDAIASYGVRGKTYYLTANEGDSRDYDGWSEEFRLKDLTLADGVFDAGIQDDANLGRLKVTSTMGVSNGCNPSDIATDVKTDCVYDTIYAYGGRSFSIWSADGKQTYDSGSEFERITAQLIPGNFNSNNDENAFDNRSDDKGPEPEGIAVGKIGKRTYAFIGLERVGGIMVYDISNPYKAKFTQYITNRDFSVSQSELEQGNAGDLGPEGLSFIAGEQSPTGQPLLVVGNEVSGSTTLYAIEQTRKRARR